MEGKIEIGKKSIDITNSLNTAISRLRSEKDSVMLWVDQICINQQDQAEQEAQIELMSLIYSRALNTVIWIGDTSAQDAFDAIHDLEIELTSHYGPLLDERKDEISKSREYKVIEQLFNNPWFQRTWTTQEACLSNEPWVMAGASRCHWEDCFGMAAVNERLGLFHPTPADYQELNSPNFTSDSVSPIRLHGFHCAIAIWEIRHASKRSLSLMEALVKTRHTQATKPHDNVYGILGLFENDIVPRYSTKVTELWQEISLKILETEIEYIERTLREGVEPYHAFRFLSCIDHGVDESGELPSWAFDWSKPRVTTSLAYSTSVVGFLNAGQSSGVSCGIRIDQTGRILSLKAKRFDEIFDRSPIFATADLKAAASTANVTALKKCIAYTTTTPANCSVRLSFLGFCKVVTAGKDGSGRRKYPDDYTEILNLLSDDTTGKSPTFHDQLYTRRQRGDWLTADDLKSPSPSMGMKFQELKEAFKSALLNRLLCWTKEGHLGLVPRFAKQDDNVVVVPGSPVPFVVRRIGKGTYHFIGECYIDGIMDGEAFENQGQELEDINLV